MSNLIMPRRELILPSSVRRRQGGFLLNPYRFATGDSDPYWSSVVLLMHMDGSNGSTTFTDQKGHTVTANGNAQISTAQNKFGGSSIALDGAGDYVTPPASHSDFTFGTGNATIEMWVRFNTAPTSVVAYDLWRTNAVANTLTFLIYGGELQFGVSGTNVALSGVLTWTTGQWYHLAAVRNGTSFLIYRDGVQVASGTNSASSPAYTAAPAIGTNINGYIDEVRITKGVARYTSNFTVPSAAFPNQ